MAVNFKAQAKKNPQDLLAPEKYYAQVVSSGRVNLDDLAEQIAYESSVNASDVYAVLLGLTHNVSRALAQGKIVELNKLGTFRLSISAEGQDFPENVTASTIEKARVLYRPHKGLQNTLKNLNFNKAS